MNTVFVYLIVAVFIVLIPFIAVAAIGCTCWIVVVLIGLICRTELAVILLVYWTTGLTCLTAPLSQCSYGLSANYCLFVSVP